MQCSEKLGMTNMHGYWKSQSWGKGVLSRKIDNIFRDTVGESIEIAVHSYYSLVAMAALYYSTLPHWYTAPGGAGYGTALLLPDWCRLLQWEVTFMLTTYISWDTVHFAEILTIYPKIASALLWLPYGLYMYMGKNTFWENLSKEVLWCFYDDLSMKKWI